MAKSKKPPTLQQQYAQQYAASQREKISAGSDKSRKDIAEIGCSLVRMGTKTVKIIEWDARNESVVVTVDGEPTRYKYPLHKNLYHRFVDFEVLEDCGYLERFANGEEYAISGKRYGVIGDVVWAGTKRYLSAEERVKFGSFRDFLARQGSFTKKPAII